MTVIENFSGEPIVLIIEDGSVVAGANTFVTDAELLAYANARGLTIAATEPERNTTLILAIDYLVSKEQSLKGCRVSADQELPYPRSGVSANGFTIASDAIPQSLKNAQLELAIQSCTSALLVNGEVNNLAGFNVDGVYSETYFSGGSWTQIRTDRADAYLLPLMKNNGSVNTMVRV